MAPATANTEALVVLPAPASSNLPGKSLISYLDRVYDDISPLRDYVDAHAAANGNVDAAPKTNGASAASTAPGSPTSVTADKSSKKKPNKKEKEREREKREEEKKASTAAPGAASPPVDRSNTPATVAAKQPLPRSGVASPAPSSSAQREQDILSPTGETESTGGRTPITNRPHRNPNTLFLGGLPVPVTDHEIREYFGAAKVGVCISSCISDGVALMATCLVTLRRSLISRSR